MTLRMTHACSTYCRAGEHCELAYLSPGTPRDAVWQAYAARGVWVTDAIPAREAPAVDAPLPPGARLDQLAGASVGIDPWLVWWREDYAQARAEYAAGAMLRWRSELSAPESASYQR